MEELREENLVLLLKLSSSRPYNEAGRVQTQRHSLADEPESKPFGTAPSLPSYLPFQGNKESTQRAKGAKLDATFSTMNRDMKRDLQADDFGSEKKKSSQLLPNKRSAYELSQDDYRRNKEIAKQSHLP